MNSKELKQEAQYIWNRLDDLAKNDPNAYKKFIEKQMEEHKILTSAPEPRICLHTKSLGGEATDVYVNICAWKRMPYPESEEEPIKLFAGGKSVRKGKGGKEVIVPVGINDQIYKECTDTEVNRSRLFEMILGLVEGSAKMKISRKFKKYEEIYKGDLPADPRTLFISRSQISSEANIEKVATQTPVNSPEELLKRMSMMDKEERDGPVTSKAETEIEVDKLLGVTKNPAPRKNLIEEIGGHDSKTNGHTSLLKPEHTLTELPADSKRPARFVLKIQLPLVETVADCDLNIIENSVELTVEGKYYLKTNLLRQICEETSTAKFNQKNRCLTVNLPLK